MIQRFLNFTIRKQISKKNKSINHTQLVRSMTLSDKIPFLSKYHKKKLIASILAIIIIYTYDLQKPIMRKIVSMRNPLKVAESFFIQQKYVPNTILQQNYAGIDLSDSTIKILISLYVTADKELYFGVGRNYLFQVYKQLGMIQTDEQIRKFWIGSGFYKQRNQKASGVGLVQFLNIFQQGLRYNQKKDNTLTEQIFLNKFANKYIQKAPYIIKWEKQFNRERTKEFLKNMPGDNQKKKDAIIQIIRDQSQKNKNLLSQEEMQSKIKQMGLKGLNLTDKMLYWQLKRTWDMVNLISLDKKMAHPLTTQLQKAQMNNEKNRILTLVQQAQKRIKGIQQNYQNLYQQKIF